MDLSGLARLGSGSACRSVFGGFSEWVAKQKIENEIKSVAVPLADESHWQEFNISLLVVSDKKKDKGSTDGMKLSKETSEFLKVSKLFYTYMPVKPTRKPLKNYK